ncbi:hypothetical protein PAPYR_13524 [Paratrimastix pyriformis]|uniref:Uncharacterized protein n=1 Tax=Paratrimastix pyriformis TaxID=342808 RepID=A0ABQ8U3M8_9EUKA|nr:hypothetical protein PAPYR_13524 [Paratrimastix pyriformis]
MGASMFANPNQVQANLQAILTSLQSQLRDRSAAERLGRSSRPSGSGVGPEVPAEWEDFRAAIRGGHFPVRQEVSYEQVLTEYAFDFAPPQGPTPPQIQGPWACTVTLTRPESLALLGDGGRAGALARVALPEARHPAPGGPPAGGRPPGRQPPLLGQPARG